MQSRIVKASDINLKKLLNMVLELRTEEFILRLRRVAIVRMLNCRILQFRGFYREVRTN